MKNSLVLAMGALLIGGCATKSLIVGDSTVQQKNITFPNVGQQVHAVAGGLVHLHANYQSKHIFTLVQPFSSGFMLGKIVVSTDEQLMQSSLDGESVFCTATKTYRDPLTGPQAQVCFLSNGKGKFSRLKAAPGAIWMSKDLAPPIDYVSAEVGNSPTGALLKRELVFEGSDKGVILFTEKIYEVSAEKASRTKPIAVTINSVPMKITLDGAELTVISYTNTSLTYSLDKSWQ